MTDFSDLMTEAAKKGKLVILIFLGMSKAFGGVSHRVLLMKVKSCSVTIPCWLESLYLTSRI